MPTTCSGRRVALAMHVMESDDVLVASIAASPTTAASCRKSCSLVARSSATASITRSASRTEAVRSAAVAIRAIAASASSCVILLRLTAPVRFEAILLMALVSASELVSVSRVSYPAIAATCAIPCPMVPAPMTATRRIGLEPCGNRASAVHDDRLAGDVVRRVRCEKDRHSLQLSRLPHASERRRVLDALFDEFDRGIRQA